MAKTPREIEATKKLMAALVRMPPKPHEDMKVGKATGKKGASPKKPKAAG